ncbi:MAG: pyridoxine 5'-phosphate synthase, partial [Deltaproteobacteria bacterium]|nr:pyridoxine 5'-phosphate synthase [Deltaproteobacteria bacterium]
GEMAASDEIIRFACEIKPDVATLVPEKREERTTEGGLIVVEREREVGPVVARLKAAGIRACLFINPDPESVRAAALCRADQVEIHTGRYADVTGGEREEELVRISAAAAEAERLGLVVAAGHGLDYQNSREICRIGEIVELNIGHSIIARSMFVGIGEAVREMIDVIASEM